MFDKVTAQDAIPQINATQAQEIYGLFKQTDSNASDVSVAFTQQKNHGLDYPFVYFQDVSLEMQALMDSAHESMMREDSPSSQSALESELSSDLLDVPTFVGDYIDYVLVYQENTSWEDFVSQFDHLKQQQDAI